MRDATRLISGTAGNLVANPPPARHSHLKVGLDFLHRLTEPHLDAQRLRAYVSPRREPLLVVLTQLNSMKTRERTSNSEEE